MSCGVSSTTDSFAPSEAYTVAISRPMMPPPMTSRRFGTPFSSSAPVESMTRGSSGMNGSLMGSEPAAMMHCSKRIFSVLPSARATSMTCGLANLPVPCTTSTLRCFASTDRPPTSLLTTLFFQSSSLGSSIFGAPNSTPCARISPTSSMTLAACSSAFEGMQPTLRQTPPSMGQRSTSVTLRPRSAARNAAV